MRYISPGVVGDWTIYEVIKNKRCIFSEAYADTGDSEFQHIQSQIYLLRIAGCPADREKGNPIIQKVGKCKTGETVHVLKAKPSQWRLYFHVLDSEKRKLEFIYAVEKKTNKRDPEDLKRCCRILSDISAGYCGRQLLRIPGR